MLKLSHSKFGLNSPGAAPPEGRGGGGGWGGGGGGGGGGGNFGFENNSLTQSTQTRDAAAQKKIILD